ncbi:MAG TPA: PaaI family thioesterase [Actinomycetota bacterium]|nr:PaaI family thioesterase [Actinomycetota bacterium]
MATTFQDISQEEVRGSFADIEVLGMNGLDRMKAAIQRQLPPPPIHYLTGLRPTEAGYGTCTFTMPASPWWLTPSGYFSWGTLAWLADAPLGGAVVTILPPGAILATSDLSMNFLRPAMPASGTLIGRARLIHAGKSLGLAECTIEDNQGRLLAHGTTRCFINQLLSPPPDPLDCSEPFVEPQYESPHPWERPHEGAETPQEAWDTMSGLEVMQAHIAGELPRPPVSHLLGTQIARAEEGKVEVTMPASGWLASPAMTTYGGALGYLGDLTLALAVQTTIPKRTVYSPLDLKVNFLRPVMPDSRLLTGHGTIAHRGRSMAVAHCDITNEDGKTVAVATCSCLILPDRAWNADEPVEHDEVDGRPR